MGGGLLCSLHPGSEEHAARLWFRVYHLFQQSLLSSNVLISKTSIETLLAADMSTAELVEKDLRIGGNVENGGRQGTW